MGVRRTGDWDQGPRQLTTGMGPRLATALRQATIRNALFSRARDPAGDSLPGPGGQAFVKLAEHHRAQKVPSKALIDTGFLVNAITQKIMADKGRSSALLRGTVSKDGKT